MYIAIIVLVRNFMKIIFKSKICWSLEGPIVKIIDEQQFKHVHHGYVWPTEYPLA